MQQMWTALQHDGPEHLGLWLNQGLLDGEEDSGPAPEAAASPAKPKSVTRREFNRQVTALPLPFCDHSRPCHCLSTTTRCLATAFLRPFTALPLPFCDHSLPLHCLSLTFRCLFTAFQMATMKSAINQAQVTPPRLFACCARTHTHRATISLALLWRVWRCLPGG